MARRCWQVGSWAGEAVDFLELGHATWNHMETQHGLCFLTARLFPHFPSTSDTSHPNFSMDFLKFLVFTITGWWWLEPWNLCLSIYWGFHHPNWPTHIFQRGRAQPPAQTIRSDSVVDRGHLYSALYKIHDLRIPLQRNHFFKNVFFWGWFFIATKHDSLLEYNEYNFIICSVFGEM